MNLIKTLKEYLEIVKSGLQHKDQIIEALQLQIAIRNKDYDNITPGALAEVMRRREICNGCEFLSTNALKAGWYETSMQKSHCTHCNCPVGGSIEEYGKEYALSANCGIEVYNNRNPQNKMKLKWEAFKPEEFNKE